MRNTHGWSFYRNIWQVGAWEEVFFKQTYMNASLEAERSAEMTQENTKCYPFENNPKDGKHGLVGPTGTMLEGSKWQVTEKYCELMQPSLPSW